MKSAKFLLSLFILLSLNSVRLLAQNKTQSLDIVNKFYNGWKSLSLLKDHSTGNAHNIECNINECTQGGDDCESKSQVSVPREIDFLIGKSVNGSITIGPYINDFEKFINDNKATFTFSPPYEIAAIKGADDAPAYRCYSVSKKYSWGGQSKELTDTIWVKANINRISGIRNEFGGSRQVSSNNLSHNQLNTFSITDMEIQASTYYDQGDYENALKLYREISFKDWSNKDANFYTFLMEGKNQGCEQLSKKYYQREAAWWLLKNYYDESFKISVSVYNIDKKITEFQKLGMPYLPNSWYENIFDALFRDPQKDLLQLSQIYSTMLPISCGLMVNCNNKNKYGFINDKGNVKIDYKYDLAFGFNENNLALVNKNGKCGYIDINGKEVIPLTLDESQAAFYNGHAFCKIGGILKLIDTDGHVIKTIQSPKEYHLLPMYRTKKYAIVQYYDSTLKKKMWDIYDYSGNIYCEGCTECKTYLDGCVIELKKSDNTVIRIDYRVYNNNNIN